MIESLLKSVPVLSDTIGAARGRLESGQVLHACVCASRSFALSSVLFRARAAFLTSSLLVGILPPSLPMITILLLYDLEAWLRNNVSMAKECGRQADKPR